MLRSILYACLLRDSFHGDLAVNIGGALAAQAVALRMEEQKSGAILLTGGGFAGSKLELSLGQHRQGRHSSPGSRAFRIVPRKRDSRCDSDCLHIRFPGIEGSLVGGRTLLEAVLPAKGLLNRRSELRPRERMTGEAIPGAAAPNDGVWPPGRPHQRDAGGRLHAFPIHRPCGQSPAAPFVGY